MSSYPMEVYSTPDQEGIPMDSGSNYENSSIPAEGFADRNQRYRKNEGWEEGTRESSHRPNPPNGDTDEFFNLPSRQKSMKPGATWRMKSRKGRKSFATIRLRHGEKFDNDDIADVIINNTGGTDNVDTAKETMEEIRELPKNMSDKKAIRDKVERRCSSKKEERSPNCLVLFYYRMSMNWQSLKGKVAEVLYSLELWKASLKTIEGNFGTGVTSYFEFLKWLFLFNIPTFLIILFFVVVPQLLWRIKGNNLAVYMASDTSFTGIELLSGGGWFKGTELFYGSYTNYTVEIIIGTKYSMRLAYLFTCGGFYVITLLTLAYSLVKSYKIHFIEGSQSNRLYYVSKVLCGWDYMVTQEDSKNLHRKTLTKELQEYLAEFREEKHTKTCGEWCRLVLLRLLINIAVLGVLAGFGYLIWYIAPLTRSATSSNAILRDITTPLVISAINLIVPFAFSYLASIENYHNPWVDIFLTMLRTITLNVVTLGALMSFWFISSDISCHSQLQTTTNTTESNTVSPVETTSSDTTTEATSSDNECIPCWENFLGQQFYCLVIVDFIFIILATFCSEFLKKILAASKKVSHPEFNIGRNTLNLIYSQSLVWLGVFYCPLLPFIMILKLFILFYIKKVSVVYNCQPSERSWRGGRTYTVILLLLFIAFQLCFLSVSYSVVFMSSSQDCGPFISYNTSYAVISEAVDDWKERNNSGFIKGLVEILTSAAFYITIFMIVCAIAYYTRLVSKGRKEIVERLRKQIQMEGKDKNFLKKVAQHVRNGANVKGTRHHATQPPVETLNPQPNGGIAGGRDNNNDPRDSYESPTRVPPETYDNDYFRASQEAPVDVMNPGYRENSPTTRPNLPYSTGQQYTAGL